MPPAQILTPCRTGQATTEAGCVAANAEERKSGKYSYLSPTYLFQPVAIESSGALGPTTYIFLRELGKLVFQESGEANSTSHLLQRLSIAVQRGNAVAVMGCARPRWPMYIIINNILYFILFYLPISCIYNKAILIN